MVHLRQTVLAWVVVLLSASFGGAAAQGAEVEERTGLRPDAPTYGVRGPHSVGTREVVTGGEAPFDLTVWYPALNSANVEEAFTYPYEIKMDAPPGAVATVSGQAIGDAPYDLARGPYPLVILSPGFSLGRTSYAWLAEHLASHGLVVIAPEHQERIDPAMSDFWRAAVTRPHDVVSTLDYAELQARAGGALAGLIDLDLVAVVGHSYGGYTALAAAGARIDERGFGVLCETARAAEDPNAWLCDLLAPNMADMAELAGLDEVPEGLWPSWADPRVDVVVSMAGDAYLFGRAGLADVTVPVLAIGGTLDTGTPYLWGTHPTYQHVSSRVKAKVALENAEHMVFASSCEALPWFEAVGFYAFCSDPVWDMNRAHDLIGHFTTAFLLAELNRDADAAAALAPDAAVFPGVTYEAQGF